MLSEFSRYLLHVHFAEISQPIARLVEKFTEFREITDNCRKSAYSGEISRAFQHIGAILQKVNGKREGWLVACLKKKNPPLPLSSTNAPNQQPRWCWRWPRGTGCGSRWAAGSGRCASPSRCPLLPLLPPPGTAIFDRVLLVPRPRKRSILNCCKLKPAMLPVEKITKKLQIEKTMEKSCTLNFHLEQTQFFSS